MKILISILLTLNLFGEDIELLYRVKFGIFGDVGYAKVKIKKSSSSYFIDLKAITEGTLALITRDRVERYQSFGDINESILTPNLYVKSREASYKFKRDKYIFDHNLKVVKIDKYRQRYEKESKEIDESKFYAKEDILSLLFNLKHYISKERDSYRFKAIGADKESGILNIDILNRDGDRVDILVKFKNSDKREQTLYIYLDRDYIPERMLLKDIDFFGDVEAKLKSKVVN